MDMLTERGGDGCFTSGLLTATGAVTTYDTTVTISYMINGQMLTKTAVTTGASPTTDANTGAAFVALQPLKACVFVWLLNAAGTVKVAQGPIVSVDPDSGLRKQHPDFPAIPDGHVAFAYHIIQTAANSSAWTFGVSNWNATGVTKLIVNVGILPSRPPSGATA